MKKVRRLSSLVVVGLFSFSAALLFASPPDEFGVKEYDDFHRVHDSFEMLAGMLPRKAAHRGLPHRKVIYDGVATEVAIAGTESATCG